MEKLNINEKFSIFNSIAVPPVSYLTVSLEVQSLLEKYRAITNKIDLYTSCLQERKFGSVHDKIEKKMITLS